jgi:hypothetical protein
MGTCTYMYICTERSRTNVPGVGKWWLAWERALDSPSMDGAHDWRMKSRSSASRSTVHHDDLNAKKEVTRIENRQQTVRHAAWCNEPLAVCLILSNAGPFRPELMPNPVVPTPHPVQPPTFRSHERPETLLSPVSPVSSVQYCVQV